MAYSTVADLAERVSYERLIYLTDDERVVPEDARSTTALDPLNPTHFKMLDRVEQVINYADSVINAHLGGRYKLPLPYVPVILKTISTELAFYRLLARLNPKIEEAWQQSYKDNMDMLLRISSGKMVLDGLLQSEAEKQEASGEFAAGNDRLFTRDTLKDF
jgi:phage gp36-like protein